MSHLSEESNQLKIEYIDIQSNEDLYNNLNGFSEVCILRLPSCAPEDLAKPLIGIEDITSKIGAKLGPKAVLIIIGDVIDLVHVCSIMSQSLKYQLWIAIKRKSIIELEKKKLPSHHFGALVFTAYHTPLKHAKTRIKYDYCPFCNKTTKDYGGKKHTYHEYGTLMSDVWRDISSNIDGDLDNIYERFADFFGIDIYKKLVVFDLRNILVNRFSPTNILNTDIEFENNIKIIQSSLVAGDCIEQLRKIPNNSIDFVFVDPPYNLKKKYEGYSDDLAITEYFTWCDKWLTELARILKPGRTCAVLNIPLWAVRHFIHMQKDLHFQNWIVWDALSFPVRFIMPAHYAILCFTKGDSRELPGLGNEVHKEQLVAQDPLNSLKPLNESFCLRSSCMKKRGSQGINDRGPLTDLWWDIHRLKHNSRRVDHPCQLPPQLMYRLISLFSNPNEIVLDCFNGAGTTTLAAHQLGRQYIGIDISKDYIDMAIERHSEISQGLDPFRKCERPLTAKNSPVPRMPKQKYRVSKKVLQLDIKRVANLIGHIPNRDEVIKYSRYPIDYYNDYFTSWGEVCAAARTTGMKECRDVKTEI